MPSFSNGLNSTVIWKRRRVALSIIFFKFVVQIKIPGNSSIWVRNSLTWVRSQFLTALFLSEKKESASSNSKIWSFSAASAKASAILLSVPPTYLSKISEARLSKIFFPRMSDKYLANSVFPVPETP